MNSRLFALGAALLLLLASMAWWSFAARSAGQGIQTRDSATPLPATKDSEWPAYGGDQGGTRFSPLTQIGPDNVGRLELAWMVRTGPSVSGQLGNLEVTPLKIGGTLYVCTGDNVVIAYDAISGRTLWRFDPKIAASRLPPFRNCRGVAYARVATGAAPCAARILTATLDAGLWALDAGTGRPCAGFGTGGRVDLLRGMGSAQPGYYTVTSAPTIVHGKVVVGGWVSDNQYVGEPSGVIRAFDVQSGALAWAWDMDRPDRHGEPSPGESYSPGTPNSWAPMSADEQLGLVFVPVGNATPDYVGMHRSPAAEKYGSSVVALDAETGTVRWHFQTVHHDVWDYDVAAQPALTSFRTASGMVPAVIQATKTAQLFVLDRRTGTPLARVEEKPVPRTGVPGERLSPTQPFASGMPSLVGAPVRESSMWGITPFDQLWCRIKLREMRYEGMYTPPSVQGSVQYPGYAGGVDWGSLAIDPERQVMIVVFNRFANIDRLIPRKEADVMGLKPNPVSGPIAAQQGTAYALQVAGFLSPLFVPCQQPPWGLIAAIDLRTRRIIWEKPLGTARDSGPLGYSIGLPITIGPPGMGGSVVTRSGITFVAAVQEHALRAIDTRTGRELWKGRLPTGGQATPMTYMAGGRQFVVIAAGGFKMWTKPGDYIVAFALPRAHLSAH